MTHRVLKPLIYNAAKRGVNRDGETFSLKLRGLTGPISYQWRTGGVDIPGETGATYTANNAAHGTTGKALTCVVTANEGAFTSAPLMILMNHAHMHHNMTDDGVMGLLPHDEVTAIARQSGDWTASTTWEGGQVPVDGDNVLIPMGVSVGYDVAVSPRFDRILVEGELDVSTTQSTQLLCETLIGGRGSVIRVGRGDARMPDGVVSEMIISDRDYRTDKNNPTDIDITRDTGVLGRGLLSLGTVSRWGAKRKRRVYPFYAPMAGDTSVVVEVDHMVRVGDRIVIPGTKYHADGSTECEERVVTAITTTLFADDTLNWAEPLEFDHDHQLGPQVTRRDLIAPIMNLESNVILRSESADVPHRRGHHMVMHMASLADDWDVLHKDLGRTEKGRSGRRSGVVQMGGTFATLNASGANITQTLTPSSNVQGRYGWHNHMGGFMKPVKDVVNSCVIWGSPGWGMVHHDVDMSMVDCAVYDVQSVGMVNESGNEIGAWADNYILRVRERSGTIMKNIEVNDSYGNRGDFGIGGYGMFFRGRANRVARNTIGDCPFSHAFFHRQDNGNIQFSAQTNLKRNNLDLRDLQGFQAAAGRDMAVSDYPIEHFTREEIFACGRGFSVTKGEPFQGHGLSIDLTEVKTFGVSGAAIPEYVGQYRFARWDMTNNGAGSGLNPGQNMPWFSAVECRTENFDVGIKMQHSATIGDFASLLQAPENPWSIIAAHQSVGDNSASNIADRAPQADEVEELPAFLGASVNAPFDLADFNGSGFSNTFPVMFGDSYSGGTQNRPMTGAVSDFETFGIPQGGSPTFWVMNSVIDEFGYYTDGAARKVVRPLIFTDRIYGTPKMQYFAVDVSAQAVRGPNNGALPAKAADPTYMPLRIVIAPNALGAMSEHQINVLGNVTDPGGLPLSVNRTHKKANHGETRLVGNDIFYTPDAGFRGTDRLTVFVENTAWGVVTAEVQILVTEADTGIEPLNTAHAMITGGTGQIDVDLFQRPDTSDRFIKRFEYSTDDGATWALLTLFWVPDVHTITSRSDGTPLAPGGYDVLLRCRTDFDDSVSMTPAAHSVSVG